MSDIPDHLIDVAPSGCWLWTGRIDPNGYGRYSGRMAYKYVYLAIKGEIPEGLHIDHLCRVRLCVNPDHLEPVTPFENHVRGYNARTECKNGHPYTPANTRLWLKPGAKLPRRFCRLCQRDNSARYAAKRSEVPL